MNFLHTEIGSAKDNLKSPVHNWYKFTAGFSYKFVEEIIYLENLKFNKGSEIFDPFAGCGTTLVSSQKEGINAIGNEGQSFMFDIIRAKLNWKIDEESFNNNLQLILDNLKGDKHNMDSVYIAHPLLTSLYENSILKDLYSIKNSLNLIHSEEFKLFFKLALSQTLHKVSLHPIAVPYISRNKFLSNNKKVADVFFEICSQMFHDTLNLHNNNTSKIYLHDSRKVNSLIEDQQCSTCITSPPYLNNLDYGEVSKVHTHFFGITNSWNDITTQVRKQLVTGSTTHYSESEFNLTDFLNSNFALQNKDVLNDLLIKTHQIKKEAKDRAGKKSFDILSLLYFNDMYLVLTEIRRVLKHNGKAYLILGDSAPYGVYIPTTEILGRIANNIGFKEFEIYKIRERGTKWKSLKYRHSIELTENVLILK